jgi:hypothetical protein
MADKSPALIAYAVRKRDGNSDMFTRIGAVFPHESGNGFTLMLDALPLDRKVVCLPPKPKDE